ncbi:adenylate cyclase type 10-like [Leguminivora glycinivorella]|uniref:adenylate cyclase type 10-like n=1 Tax=Leguminivora glycinivorella TaxID=1035111 RepID=UPI00200FCD10|nr:adenylate cyclase type 10-like [Leguminivora glycinivorella]
MKRTQREAMMKTTTKSPRERDRESSDFVNERDMSDALETAGRGSIIASMVPDEVILQHSNYAVRQYETALMLIDVSGFTDLCENFTKADRGSPSRLTQVLNSYIGAMVQEILSHGGDILNFAGDAILSMWKKMPSLSMQSVVHLAIDCGLNIQKNHGTKLCTDVGVVLRVKVAISCGVSHFALIGDATHSHYVVLGQPVWDIKVAEYLAVAGDVIASPSAWRHANEAEYISESFGDGTHTRVLQVAGPWKRFSPSISNEKDLILPTIDLTGDLEQFYKKFTLRPVIITALRSRWWPTLRKFMVQPVIWAVENDEPMEFLTEIRRVVVVFLNIVTKTVTDETLVEMVDTAFKCVYSTSSAAGGLLNKVSLFDKDLMFLLVFGLRGMSHGDEAQKGLLCAQALKDRLLDPNILSVSIGISSGTTYCGVVGHVLRREYTVIGTAANKAARLMTAYRNKLVCDKETFLRSKIDPDFFRLMELKPLKGIKKPGPVYEFNKYGWPERPSASRQPILGREEELRAFILALQEAMEKQHEPFMIDRSLVYGVAFVVSIQVLEVLLILLWKVVSLYIGYFMLVHKHIVICRIRHILSRLGPAKLGKKRLVEECIYLTPNCVRIVRISLNNIEKIPYGLFRQIALKTLVGSSSERDKCENQIRTSLDLNELSPNELYAINVIFGCRLELPPDFEFTGDILDEDYAKDLVRNIFEKNIASMCIVVIDDGTNIDDESWRLLLVLLDTKKLFLIMTLPGEERISEAANQFMSSKKLLKLPLTGLDYWYHSVIACQFLDVQAIPTDLEKLIQSASNGISGWIQDFIISLVQQGDLTVETTTRDKAMKQGAVMPERSLLYSTVDLGTTTDNQVSLDAYFKGVLETLNSDNIKSVGKFALDPNEHIQIAVLADTFDVLNIRMSAVDADAMIMKTYDSLNPLEKMMLKCCSVLGVVFPRRMVEYLVECDSKRKIAQAVAKLFSVRVLECQGGDFTQETSKVLVHQAPEVVNAEPPYCGCRGTEELSNCADLPKYAFCGYMRFKCTLFQTTTYELLTEIQKHDLHERALLYLKKYTRRCWYCGEGCFHTLLGKRTNDGLVKESTDLKNTQEMMQSLAEESNHVTGDLTRSRKPNEPLFHSSAMLRIFSEEILSFPGKGSVSTNTPKSDTHVRSFSSLDVANCECRAIALAAYDQIIDHCCGAGQHEQLFEAYLEYALLCLNSNTPQALCLLNEAEIVIMSEEYWDMCKVNCKISWFKDFCLGRIMSLRGVCMIASGEFIEARKHLHRALELFRDPFPTTKYQQTIRNMHISVRQWMAFKVAPKAFVGTEDGLIAFFYEEVAVTLNRLYTLFIACKEYSSAELTAKWSLDYALRSNANFTLLCDSYRNMLTTHLNNKEISKCVKIVNMVIELCRRKRGQLDDAEARAVCVLYTTVFLFYVEYGKKNESLEFGVPVMHMVTMLKDSGMRVRLVVSVLRLLLSDLRLNEMVILMKENLYRCSEFNLNSTTWYYTYSLMILIETGYCVETYQECERFYMQHGDTILTFKSKDAAWDYFGCMWLITVRVCAWETSVLWEKKVKEIMSTENKQIEYKIHLQLILLEGWLIMLVREIDAMNEDQISIIKGTIKNMFEMLSKSCQRAPIYQPRYFLLLAYFNYIKGNKFRARSYLEKTFELAKELAEGTTLIWAEHTRQHWTGTLEPELEDYWVEHIEPDNLLNYRHFNKNVGFVPFTLPLPKALLRCSSI